MNLDRRTFFRRVVGVVGAMAALPVIGKVESLSALNPIIEFGTPLEDISKLTLKEVIARAVQACERNETQWPGFTRALYDVLNVKIYGLPPVGFPSAERAPTKSLQEIAQGWVNWMEKEETRAYPGLTRAVYEALTPRMVGVPFSDLERFLWQVKERPMDGWTHHALAMTEGERDL